MKNSLKYLIWIGIALALMVGWNVLQENKQQKSQIKYSQLINKIDNSEVVTVTLQGSLINGYKVKLTDKNNNVFNTFAPQDSELLPKLLEKKVKVEFLPEEKPGILQSLLINSIPFLLLIAVWIYFMRQMQGGGGKGGAFSFGKSRARLLDKDTNKITFADVAGCDESKLEIQEIVDYLKAPSKYQSLGGKVPRGVLLVGSPGTGKTLLAKATAGEAKVPFFSISGSDFVEMFVGVGASRVRDMFEQAKKNAPCIIFIDEIDAVGRQRGAGLGGGNDEREQTLNQLLVEMDGFDSKNTVIVIAATNRPDVLDPALLRPGRFDRQVMVPLPDIIGREQILKVHMKKIEFDKEVDLLSLARGTPGFSGADLANLVNEAALMAGRKNKIKVDQSDFEEAKDKIYMGPERKSLVMTDDEKKVTAYHESGHAIVASSLPETDPVHKVTIVPRGRALGITWQLPERDTFSVSEDQLLNKISILFGGRIAEDIFIKKISTGASNDFEKATQIARDMVVRYGMSKKMGPITYVENENEVFLGRSVTQSQHVSEKTMKQIDMEIKRIVDEQYEIAETILKENRDKVEIMTQALMDWETIDAHQVQEIMKGKNPSLPKDYSHNFAENNKKASKESHKTKKDKVKVSKKDDDEIDTSISQSKVKEVAQADEISSEKKVLDEKILAKSHAVKQEVAEKDIEKKEETSDKVKPKVKKDKITEPLKTEEVKLEETVDDEKKAQKSVKDSAKPKKEIEKTDVIKNKEVVRRHRKVKRAEEKFDSDEMSNLDALDQIKKEIKTQINIETKNDLYPAKNKDKNDESN